jgi:TnsA endonuclease N terminal
VKVKVGGGLRRIPLSRRSHIIGFQPLRTGTVEHESALERDFVTLSGFLDRHAAITSQPVTIEFLDGAKARRYTPDFLVDWSSGPRELVEVKYRKDLHTHWSRLKPGFVAARRWAHEHDATFRIATERRIRGSELENAKRLLPLREAPLDVDAAQHVLAVGRSMHRPTFGQMLAASQVPRALALATVWRLIARGALRADLSAPIGFDTILSLP